jgi:PhnB protein
MARSSLNNVFFATWSGALRRAIGHGTKGPTAMPTSHVPNGLPTVIPQLVVSDGRKFAAFLEATFGAQVADTIPTPDGKGIMHGYLTIDGNVLFFAEPFGPAPVTKANMFVYVRDVDAVVGKALAAGATAVAPVGDMPWGDRWGMVEDPFGNLWQIATHIEDVDPAEMKRRMAQPPR